jgi:hypothetical protein
MYALMINEGEAVVVDGGGLDNDNEILGATSEEGMPLTLTMNDALIERVRAKTM